MQKPEDYKSNMSTCIVLQGPPGCGKTTLGCMFPNVYVADCDLNLRSSIKYLKDNNLPPIVGFDTIDIDDNGKLVEPKLRYKRLSKCLADACAMPNIDTILIDSTTKVAQYMQDKVMTDAGKSEMSIKLWGDYLYLWRHFINTLRCTGKYILLTSHEVAERDEADTLRYFLHIPGSIKHELGVYVTDIWRCETRESGGKTEYRVRTNPTEKFLLKNTLGMPAALKTEPAEILKYLKQLATRATPTPADQPVTK